MEQQQEGDPPWAPIQHEVPDWVPELIAKAYWQSAKSVEAYAPHEYCVIGWEKDELTEREFWSLATAFQKWGRHEEWTPPEGWTEGRVMKNWYLYPGDGYAYWVTRGRKPMLNRERLDWQAQTKTRTIVRKNVQERLV